MHSDPRSAVLRFSESDYTAVEGGGSNICLELVSLTGSGRLIENVTVGFTVPRPQGPPIVQSSLINLPRIQINGAVVVFCRLQEYDEDNFVLGVQQFVLTAFVMVDEPDSVSFTLGGDQANITYIDNDGTLASIIHSNRISMFTFSVL